MRDSPCRNPLSPRQQRQKILMVLDGSGWETPRGGCDEHSGKFSLSKKPRFNRPVGERRDFWSCCWLTSGRAHYRRQQQRGTCTQHNQSTLPQLTVRLSISPVCWTQRIRRIEWKEMFAESKHNRIAVEFISKGNRTGVYSSLEVSLHKEIACWVNKLQLENWQNIDHTWQDDYYEIWLGITT